MNRKASTVKKGHHLFNMALSNENEQPNNCIKNIFKKLFTTEYDHILINNQKSLQDSSNILCSYMTGDLQNTIPKYIDNGVFNIILDILCDGSETRKQIDCKRMYHYYMDIAKTAFKKGDHNTCILVKCALDHTIIKRLDIKNTKSENKLMNTFTETYGDFLSCYSKHVEQILINKHNLSKFIPSVMVLNMHLKKNKMYVKSYNKLGKYPKKLIEREAELKQTIKNISKFYKQKSIELDLINLYKVRPDNKQLLTPSRRSNSLMVDCFTMVNEIKGENPKQNKKIKAKSKSL